MKRIFFYIILLVIVPVIVSAQSYGHQGGGTSFKSVTDTTNNSTGAGKTFWFGDSPWIHDGDYYKKLGYYHANGLQIGFGYRFGRTTGTNGQILALRTASTPDSTYWTTYTPDASDLWTRNTGAGYTYLTNLTDKVGIGLNTPLYTLDCYTPRMAWNVPTAIRVRGSSVNYPNRLILGADVRIESFRRAYSGSIADNVLRLSLGGKTETVTGSIDTVNISSTWGDFLSLDICRNTNMGFRFSFKDAAATGNNIIGQIFRISPAGYFYVGDTTTADKDWRLYVGDDGAWTGRYFGFDDGNSEWNIEGANYTFNVGGGAYNWRAAGDTNPNLLTTIGSTDRVGVGTSAPDKKLEINSATGACMRHTYNDNNGSATNYVDYSVSSGGDATITPSGGDLTLAGYLNNSQTVNQSSTPGYTCALTASTLQSGAAYTGTDATMSTQYIATKFTASAAHTMGDFQIRVKESANITNYTDYFTGYIYADDGGSPSKPTGSALATGYGVRFGHITSSYQTLSVGTTYTMTNGVNYWLVLKYNAAPTGGSLVFDSAVSSNIGATSADGSTWTNSDVQLYHVIRGRTPYGTNLTNTNNFAIYCNSINSSEGAFYSEGFNCPGGYGFSYNSYGLRGTSINNYGGVFTSQNNIGLYADKAYILGDCSAGSFTDRCEAYEDDAIQALVGIRSKQGAEKSQGFAKLDHQTLPGAIYTVSTRDCWQEKKNKKIMPVGWEPADSLKAEYEPIKVQEEGRDLSKLVSMLVKAIQEQAEINAGLNAKIEALEARVLKLENPK